IERLLIACDELGIELAGPKETDVYIVTLGDAARKWGLGKLPKLREKGLSATMDYQGRSMKAQMKDANRENARFAVIVGDHELESGKFTLRDMKASEEKMLTLDEIMNQF
ncbi:MAG: His/Gly/Thr/Pro-type tRNA ligase C-terminal domain-containing protein, partial [Balneolaceae bacterium]